MLKIHYPSEGSGFPPMANERILFMKLGSGMYKEIARDALKGNWMKANAAGFAAGWLGVFSSSF